jgi:hypothetical protein
VCAIGIVREAVAEYLRNQRPHPKGIGPYDSRRSDVSARTKELFAEAVKPKYKVRLPLIPSKHPGTPNLTNAEIEDLLTGSDV